MPLGSLPCRLHNMYIEPTNDFHGFWILYSAERRKGNKNKLYFFLSGLRFTIFPLCFAPNWFKWISTSMLLSNIFPMPRGTFFFFSIFGILEHFLCLKKLFSEGFEKRWKKWIIWKNIQLRPSIEYMRKDNINSNWSKFGEQLGEKNGKLRVYFRARNSKIVILPAEMQMCKVWETTPHLASPASLFHMVYKG